MQRSLKELADLVGGELAGSPELQILGAADIADAEEGDIVFAETPRLLDEAVRSKASVIIAFLGARDSGKALKGIRVDPRGE